MRKRSGLTLFELLVAAVVAGIVSAALARAFSFGLEYPVKAEESRERHGAIVALEERLTDLISRADLTSDAGNTAAYFLAGTEATGEPERITFTLARGRVPEYMRASGTSFEEQHERYGPIGGLVEVSIGLTPVGEAPEAGGLFLREQRPSDGDPAQGGVESRISGDVEEFSVELFDGAAWQTAWDSRSGQRRLPALARLTYRLQNEETPRVLIVRLTNSDATAENPVSQGSAAP